MDILDDMGENEEIQLVLKQHYLKYVLWYIVGLILILTISLSPLGITLFLIAEFFRRGHAYYITNLRLISEFRFISRSKNIIGFERMDKVDLDWGFLGKIMGIGNLVVHSSPPIEDVIEIKGIKNPQKVKKFLEKISHPEN